LKALSYFGDVPELAVEVQERLRRAVESVDVSRLPGLKSYMPRADDEPRP